MVITRRALIGAGIKAGVGLSVLYQLPGMVRPVLGEVTHFRQTVDRFQLPGVHAVGGSQLFGVR